MNIKLTAHEVFHFLRKYHTSLRAHAQGPRELNLTSNPLNMPLNSGKEQRLNMQKYRLKIKQRQKCGQQYPYMGNVSLHILGCGARGSATCLYMSTDCSKYIFNCGEGVQRLAQEHRFKLTKLDHVFVTSASWKNLGGLPGVLLTLQTIGITDIKLHAPKGSIDMIEQAKKFAVFDTLTVSEVDYLENQLFTNNVITVSYVPISKTDTDEQEIDAQSNTVQSDFKDDTNYYPKTEDRKRTLDTQYEKRKLFKPDRQIKRIADVLCYVCKLRPRAGVLSVTKCVEHGVPPGPALGQLKAGHDIVLENGKTVKSEDVCEPPTPGSVFLVVDCPTMDYLDSFVNQSAFEEHQYTTSDKTNVAYCVFHFTPQEVLNEERYQAWMNKFGPDTQHILLNDSNTCMGSEAVHRHQHGLHQLHPEIFPLLDETYMRKEDEPDKTLMNKTESAQVQYGTTLYTIHLQPKRHMSQPESMTLHPELYRQQLLNIRGVEESLKELRGNIITRTNALTNKTEYPKLIMLGTGSSVPNKHRNTSGILLRIDEQRSMLLDCGEGTIGQIIRYYGLSEANNILSTIKAIYISHLHADHHIGLIGLLKEREMSTQEPVFLLAPEQITPWLEFYHQRFEPILHLFNLVPNTDLMFDRYAAKGCPEAVHNNLDMFKITTTHVRHCPHSFGVSLEFNNGQKIVYSGDTMPSDKLIALGKNCDLLLHEATMEDGYELDAKQKSHSTISQAIDVGKQMNAKFTLLTHFSQRYSKMPLINEDKISSLSNVGIAFDNMEIRLSQLTLLPLFYPILHLIFNDFCDELKKRTDKKSLKLNCI